jgi:hypothetical protein
VAHGARILPPWGMALGLLTPWPTALGFLLPCPAAAGIWPHLAGQPTVGATPNTVHDARCIFLEIFSSTIYFSKIKEKYKKFHVGEPGRRMIPSFGECD